MAEFVKVGNLSDFPEGKMKRISVKGKDLLVASIAGEIYSMDQKSIGELRMKTIKIILTLLNLAALTDTTQRVMRTEKMSTMRPSAPRP